MSTDTPSSQPTEAPLARRRIGRLAATVAAAGVVGVGAFALLPGDTPEAVAAVQSAAASTSELTDFRVTMVGDIPALPGGEVDVEVDGGNFRATAEGFDIVRVGDTEWLTENGTLTVQPVSQGETFLPFDEASEAVLTAALASKNVTDQGSDEVRGTSTTRYAIVVDDSARAALGNVSAEAQFWFVGDYEVDEDAETGVETRLSGFLEDASQIDVWVADGLIHQISVDDASGPRTYTFYDFGADITITPPKE